MIITSLVNARIWSFGACAVAINSRHRRCHRNGYWRHWITSLWV